MITNGGKKSGQPVDANGYVYVQHGLGVVPDSIQVTDISGTVAGPRTYSVSTDHLDANQFAVKVAIEPDSGGDMIWRKNGASTPVFYWTATKY